MVIKNLAAKKIYWEYQYLLGRDYLVPLLKDWGISLAGKWVLDIGCAEAGVLCAFAEEGARSIGMEISPQRITLALHLAQPRHLEQIRFVLADFLNTPLKPESHSFDLILLRDVIEHLPEKHKVLARLHALMGTHTRLFITFPPFYSPFGGHQQVLHSGFRYLPYFHALPTPFWLLFRFLISHLDTNSGYLKEVEKLRRYRISIGLFLKSIRLHNFRIVAHRFYLSRPSHRLRYGFPVIITNHIGRIPYLRELLITGAFFLLAKEG